MVAPATTVWQLEPHSRAKHEILRRYLSAWMPILSQGGFPEILYIDGFAGPGEYNLGKDGSPIIAINTACSFQPALRARVRFLFVELDTDRAIHLKSKISGLSLPTNFQVTVMEGTTFEDALERYFSEHAQSNNRFPPIFAFIDPFGWKGVPFSIIKKILSQGNSEVFLNFIYEEINRFLGHPDQIPNFTSYFGTEDWKPLVTERDPLRRNRGLHDLYAHQLRAQAKAKYVHSFEMKNGRDVTDYFLFYATNSLLGLKKMKEAMWKVDEAGEFTFSDATDPNQFILFEKSPNFDLLRQAILVKYSGRSVTIRDLEEFVVSETAFRETHYKKLLAMLEKEGALKVQWAPGNRRLGFFPYPQMVVAFEKS
jgi:three-Cys-motif partner protein